MPHTGTVGGFGDPGRQRPEFRDAPGLQGSRRDYEDQRVCRDAGPAQAYDLCSQRRRRAAGPSAHRVPGAGRSGGESKPTADKKTQRWLQGWRDISRLTAGLANDRMIAMMGRESDAIDLFCAWRDEGGAGLLIRATHDRGLAEETTLFETLRAAPAHGSTRSGSIVPRRGARRVRRSAPGSGRRSTCRSRNAGARS